MFCSIKNLCIHIDNKIELIERNKKSNATIEVIQTTNKKIQEIIELTFEKLKTESCNKTLIKKYENKIKKNNYIRRCFL
jgi:inorganic pyrophosphatase